MGVGVIRFYQGLLFRFGPGYVENGELGLAEIEPGEQVFQFVAASGQLFLIAAFHAPFRQVAAQIPDHLAVRAVVGGDGEYRFVAGANTVSIEAVAQIVFHQQHFQWPQLAVFLWQQAGLVGAVQQCRVAIAGGQDGQRRLDTLAIDGHRLQSLLSPFQRIAFPVEGQQAFTYRRGQGVDQ